MNLPTPPQLNPQWKLEIYDQAGETVTVGGHIPNQPPAFAGDVNALIDALPSITGFVRFFIDPADQARACYEAYREAWETTYDSTLPSWAELLAMPHKAALVGIWQATAKAAASVDPTLN